MTALMRALRRAAGELARIRDVAAGTLDETIAALDRAILETAEVQEGIGGTARDPRRRCRTA